MKLAKVTVHKYKSFLTEQSMDIEPSITRVVGKNESGKSALLEAIAKSNYHDQNDKAFKFNKDLDFPRSGLVQAKKENPTAISCEYVLSDEEVTEIEEEFYENVLTDKTFTVTTRYDDRRSISGVNIDYEVFAKWLAQMIEVNEDEGDVDQNDIDSLLRSHDFKSIYDTIESHKSEADWKTVAGLIDNIKKNSTWETYVVEEYIYKKYISPHLPKFWYFSDYFSLPARINLSRYKSWIKNQRNSSDENADGYRVVDALLELSGLTIEDLENEANFEEYKATLESTSNNITDEMFKFWKTNENLEIEFALEHNTDLYLNIRVKNRIHRVTIPLKNRSKGFMWFFSFLVWFNKLQVDDDSTYILLLDEPGLSLHATAQSDLLRFIEERVAHDYQVIYTTHSPFMIDTAKLDQVRTVYDTQDPKIGSVISSAVDQKDSDTLFPLQAALGYTLAQNLYIAEKNLLVEGISDLIYLSHFSALLNEMGREGLHDDITIVPVGGAEKIATFISLMRGNKLKCVCLLDTFTEQKAKDNLRKMVEQQLIADKKILFADSFTNHDYADIEDFFVVNDYLGLYNGAFAQTVSEDQIKSDKNIMPQLKRLNDNKSFNHYTPAKYLMKNAGSIQFEDTTLDVFESVFKAINKLLK